MDMNGVGAPLAALKKALLSNSSEKGKGGAKAVVPEAGDKRQGGAVGEQVQQGAKGGTLVGARTARTVNTRSRLEPEAAGKVAAPETGGKRAGCKGKAQYEVEKVTGMREADGVVEYEVKWKACDANNNDDDEHTWEEQDCEAALGGLQKHIDRWWRRQRG